MSQTTTNEFPFKGMRNRSRDSMEFHTQRLLEDPFGPKVLIQLPEWVNCDPSVHVDKFVRFPSHGMGIVKGKDGRHNIVPHTGEIKIEENVIILEHATIIRPVNYFTVIGENTVIGVGAHIGHNVNIGSNVFITSKAILCGSVTVGSDVDIGAGAIIKNKVRIGKGAVIGIGAVVICDVPDGETWAGNPAKKIQ